MREAMFLIFGVLSAMALVSLSYFVAQATVLKGRGWLHSVLEGRRGFAPMTFKIKAYLSFSAVALFVCIYGGYEYLLWWIPDSLGSHDEDGAWTSLRSYVAAIAAFLVGSGMVKLAIEAIGYANETESISSRFRVATIERDGLSKIIDAGSNKSLLEIYRAEFSSELDREEALDLDDSEIYPSLLEFPETRANQKLFKIKAYKRLVKAADKALANRNAGPVDA